MTSHRRGIAQDDEFHAGTGDGDIHSAEVAEESDLSFIVGTHEGDEDDIALLSLEAIDGIHADETAIGLEELTLLEQATKILHLGTIRRDNAHIDALVEDALLADLLEITLEREQRQFGLGLVDTAKALAHELLAEEGFRRRLSVWLTR